ncbi:MAG TPA: autotransporter domain-containing protein [Chthoniobacter sp.]|nr:autotransporter domain-containing protein [Chthoniobacter sp.]
MKATKRPPILSTSAAALFALLLAGPIPAKAAVLTWTGEVDNYWETMSPTTNWTSKPLTPFTDTVPSDLHFAGTRRTNTINNGNFDIVNSITFDANAGNFILNGRAVELQGGGSLVNNAKGLQVINFASEIGVGGLRLTNLVFVPFVFQPHITFNAAAGDILINSDISIEGFFPTSGVTLVVDGPHNITIAGNVFEVSGSLGTLEKNGTGTLRLLGKDAFSGGTVISDGVVQVDGTLITPRTSINPGGTLSGKGYIEGNVFNFGGNVAPGDSPGTLTIRGNYIQTAEGTLTIEVKGAKSGEHDLLAVTQHATIDGDLRIKNVGGGGLLKPGKQITILSADRGVNGTFSDVSFGGTLPTARVVYSATTVSLEGLANPFSDFAKHKGYTPNQVAVAQGLDVVAFQNKQPKLLNYLISEQTSKLPDDLDRIAPEELTSIFTIGTALANVQTANLQRRTSDLRAGSHGFSASGFATAGSGPLYSGGVAGPSGSYDGKESKEVKNVVPAEDRWGVFITGVGEWVNVDGDNNARGYDINTGGFTVGVDYKVTPNFAVGLMAGYAGTGTDLNNGGRVFVNGGKLGLYATYFTGGFYVDTAVNGGYNSYDLRRDGLNGTARSDTDGGEVNVLFATGYDFKVGGLTVGPTASFQYTYLGIDSFEERGSLAPLRFKSQGQDSVRTSLGMKASYDWKVGGVVIRPELRAAWQHEFGDDSYALDSSFNNGNGDLFTVNGPVIGRDSLLLGAGFAILWNERTSTYVYYDGELGRSNYNAHNVSGGVRVSF